jgi:hypothetical protein
MKYYFKTYDISLECSECYKTIEAGVVHASFDSDECQCGMRLCLECFEKLIKYYKEVIKK